MRNSKEIAIVGAGGLGKETAVLINQINRDSHTWEVLGFYDDYKRKGEIVAGLPVLGGIEGLNSVKKSLSVVVAIGDPRVKKEVVHRINNSNINHPSLIHPAATIGENISVGLGCIITAGSRLTIDVMIGDFVLLNLNCTVGHDANIGSYSSIMPGVHLSGYVDIEEEVLVGTGVSILQNVNVGKNAVIGAGALVNKSIERDTIVVGVPAKPINK